MLPPLPDSSPGQPRGARRGPCLEGLDQALAVPLLRVVVTGGRGCGAPPSRLYLPSRLAAGVPSGTIIAGNWTDGSGDPMGSSRCGQVWVATTGSGRMCEARSL